MVECLWAFGHVGFFFVGGVRDARDVTANADGTYVMDKEELTTAERVGQAARAFQQQRTGHAPKAVTVILSEDTLVITLHEALSPAERALARTAAGAAKVQEYHRQLFSSSAEPLRREIARITGRELREAAAEVEPSTGSVVQVFTTGTMVQVFQFADSVPAEA